jgi:hypothetical protein
MADAASVGPASAGTVEPRFITGPVNVEDIVRVPGTDWLIGSGMASPGIPDGRLHVVGVDGTWWALTPDDVPVRHDDERFEVGERPSTAGFDPHGVALRRGHDGVHELYVVNHGGREAIEVYEVDARGERPRLTWIGAILQDTNVWGNAVAVLPDGGLVATNFMDPSDEGAMDRIARGEVTGNLKEWQPGTGWTDIPGTETCAPNGVEASPDGSWLYICGWGTRTFSRVSRGAPTPRRDEVPVDVMPDNVKWGADGRLIVAGSVSTPLEVFAEVTARDVCPIPLRVIRIDPETLAAEEAVSLDHDTFGTAATGYDVDGDLWIASPRSDRIAVLPGLGR